MIGTSRSPETAERLRALGAEPVVLDALDPRAVREAVAAAEPDAIVHQATALADVRFSRNLDRSFAETNRLRTEGTDALLAAAREAGVPRFVAQSFANFRYAREGGPAKTEDDPLDPRPDSARDGGAAVVCGETGDQTDQESRSAAHRATVSVTATYRPRRCDPRLQE